METELKQCRSECKKYLPLSAFGVNRNYPDGKHVYCKQCCNAKRKLARANGYIEPRYEGRTPRTSGNKSQQMVLPTMRVLEVIREGARTQDEIRERVKIGEDQLCDVLAELILDRKQVVTQSDGEVRKYYTRAA